MTTSKHQQTQLVRAEGCRRLQRERDTIRHRRSPLRDLALRPHSPLA